MLVKIYKCLQPIESVVSKFIWQCVYQDMKLILYINNIPYWSKVLWAKQPFIAHSYNECPLTPLWLLDKLETPIRPVISVNQLSEYSKYCFIEDLNQDLNQIIPNFIQQKDGSWDKV